MIAALYTTKKALKEAIGQDLRHRETSMFNDEFKPDGTFNVVGPDERNRKWYATVTMANGKIKTVK